MGNFTLTNFRSELLFDLKNRSDTAAGEGLTTTRQDAFINAAYLWVCHPAVFRHRELMTRYTITLATGTNVYTFTPAPGTVNIEAIRYVTHVQATTDAATATKVKVKPRDEQWFEERSLASGAPRDYAVRGNDILVSPVPGTAENNQLLAVGAWREPALLSGAASRTVISARFDEIVLLAARWRAELHLGYRDLAEATKLDVVALVNEYAAHEQLHGEDWDWSNEVRMESSMETV